jgi:hypothetical protein
MKRLLFTALFVVALLTPSHSKDVGALENMTTAQLQDHAAELHPAALYLLAGRLLAEGKGQQAANWMYAGQLRYRFLLEAEGASGHDEAALFTALSEEVGRPVNEYIAGDVDDWLAAIDWALEWDAANDNVATSKREHAAALAKTRNGLESFRDTVEEQRATIPQERKLNGLENR